jgi:hypothetical protein
VYQGISALLRVLSGLCADRRQRHKKAAATGYALSAFCKLGLLAAGTGVERHRWLSLPGPTWTRRSLAYPILAQPAFEARRGISSGSSGTVPEAATDARPPAAPPTRSAGCRHLRKQPRVAAITSGGERERAALDIQSGRVQNRLTLIYGLSEIIANLLELHLSRP